MQCFLHSNVFKRIFMTVKTQRKRFVFDELYSFLQFSMTSVEVQSKIVSIIVASYHFRHWMVQHKSFLSRNPTHRCHTASNLAIGQSKIQKSISKKIVLSGISIMSHTGMLVCGCKVQYFCTIKICIQSFVKNLLV